MSSIPICDGGGNNVPRQYLLQIHDGTTTTKTLVEMDGITDFPAKKTSVALNLFLPLVDSLPAWLKNDSKVTYDHPTEFHKGFLVIGYDGAASFSCHHQ